MNTSSRRLTDLEQLRTFVKSTLCNHSQLDTNMFPMTERILVRAGKPCGIFFSIRGPRAMRLTAIWDQDRNTVLFYGSSGERFHKIQLIAVPRSQPVAT